MVIIKEKERSMVKPSEKTPHRRLWLSMLDLMENPIHNPVVYFFRSSNNNNNNNKNNFFDANILKQSLSRVLVPFYPIAGRFGVDHSGRTEIDCNEEGVLFVTAETTAVIDDFGDFAPTPILRSLTPTVDYSLGISSYPFLLVQVTYFKCGGVSVGIAIHHFIVDGISAFHFIESWSRIARGLEITIPPFLDRTLLKPDHDQNPILDQSCKPADHNNNNLDGQQQNINTSKNNETKVAIFNINKEQLNTLKAKAKEDNNNNKNFSSFESLASHIWRCICQAREQSDDEESTLYFPVNGRFSNRLTPQLPLGYFGNVIFAATPMIKVGDLKTKSLSYVVSYVHRELEKMDNDYLRSNIECLELQQANVSSIRRKTNTYVCPNLGITSWVRLINYDEVDFGWGRAIYIGPGGFMYEGKSYVIPCPNNDGSLLVGIALQPQHMKTFEKLFYQI
ncbi:hypothetical protein CsatA_022007 [Cannabis sativa]